MAIPDNLAQLIKDTTFAVFAKAENRTRMTPLKKQHFNN
jgi:hypothetical protein